MSDTPRTDVQKQYLAFELDENGVMIPVVRKDFACELERENARLREDAERYRWLQNQPVPIAQAFFWNYQSRKQRSKAIDKARHVLRDTEAK